MPRRWTQRQRTRRVERLITTAKTDSDTDKHPELLCDLVRIYYLEASRIFPFDQVQTHVAASRLH